MRNTLRELLLSAVRLEMDVLTSPSISVVHGMVSLTEGSGVANTLASDVEKESTSGIDILALSMHMPTRKKVIINMQLNSLLKLFFIKTLLSKVNLICFNISYSGAGIKRKYM